MQELQHIVNTSKHILSARLTTTSSSNWDEVQSGMLGDRSRTTKRPCNIQKRLLFGDCVPVLRRADYYINSNEFKQSSLFKGSNTMSIMTSHTATTVKITTRLDIIGSNFIQKSASKPTSQKSETRAPRRRVPYKCRQICRKSLVFICTLEN